ncbi:MAG: DUF885 domain-containing protein [Anaerolineae bacterium]|nr:DUF885 domain-containing protein [Anaerolineae bacterium]
MSEEARFYERAEHWFYRLLEFNPVAATQIGDHRFDDQLADMSGQALDRQQQEILSALAEFRAIDRSGLALSAQIDHELTVAIFEMFAREYEQGRGHLRNPGTYLDEVTAGVFLLTLLDFAPLPQRLASALGRVRQVPRVLREGRANLVPAEVPPVWAEIALEQAASVPGLYLGLLPMIASQAAPDLVEPLTEAGQAAAAAVQEFATYLQEEVLPVARGDFAAGTDLFNQKLAREHMVDYDADQLIEIGWEIFHHTREQMQTVAAEIDPHRTVRQILEDAKNDHPTAEMLIEAYQKEMTAIRQYVIDQGIATIPPGEQLKVIETPSFLRPILPYAAYMQPGLLEEKQEGHFLVTPIDPDSPPEEQEQTLKGHYWAKLPITALHEAYPGHHLQLIWANRQPTIPRRLGSIIATLFIEGWAFYCEELLEELGYISQPVQRLGRLSDQLWRAARIILDVSLHTRGMPVDDAVAMLVDECGLEPANALAEVRRYTQTPTQPQSYLMGKRAILNLVEDYRRAHPGVTLRELHDAILGAGSLPPRLMRRHLGLD